MNPMSTETQPSEHAMQAAWVHFTPIFEMFENEPEPPGSKCVVELAARIDTHAIAPAVAEIKKELLEEARLNGKGSEREAKLLAQVAERDRRMEKQLTAAQAEIAELRATIKENIATIKALSEQVGAASANPRPNESNSPTK